MSCYNIVSPEQRVPFPQAVRLGIGRDQGLFLPENLEPLGNLPELLDQPFADRSAQILSHLVGSSVPGDAMREMVGAAFNFPLPLVAVQENIHALELFHGTSLAFKDFGARFMAQCLGRFHDTGPMTILTATSGDTGAAVRVVPHGAEEDDDRSGGWIGHPRADCLRIDRICGERDVVEGV